MGKKLLLVVSVIIVFAVIISFALLRNNSASNLSPEKKIENLKYEIDNNLESSGYNYCIQRINERSEKIDEVQKKIEECISNKIKDAGYADGLDCIKHFNDPICQDTNRYNTEINAINDCQEKIKFDDDEFSDIKNITIVDCAALLNK